MIETKEGNKFYTRKEEKEDEHIHKPTVNEPEESLPINVKEKDQKRPKKKYKDPDPGNQNIFVQISNQMYRNC